MLHGAVLDIVGMMNGPQRDEMMIREAGIRLDRALFPLLVLVERFGPIGVVDLADRVGRDYTTVSRQLGKLEAQQLIERCVTGDRRVRLMAITESGKAMTDRIDAARERILRAGFADWAESEIDDLVRLVRRFADAMRESEIKERLKS
ncbi:MarR family winged helix-turn-helix transcriptional regulator [Flavisphingomonas formosensis]|uniref:MarR family winged helix-turn-helix transcriptional regulator n=1 Tax=Flavisphingomonas formosensis TaxID=861534 RepID=UPI001E5286D7|nr:MarR family transcriptional regulator [Sphingomonas formosensis]